MCQKRIGHSNPQWVIGTGTEVNSQSWTQHLLFICEEEH